MALRSRIFVPTLALLIGLSGSAFSAPPIEPAQASTEAVRDAPPPTPTPGIVDVDLPVDVMVNSLTYNYGDSGPAIIAYRLVAESEGWPWETIMAWEPAAKALMAGESGFCPNLRRGAKFNTNDGRGCTLKKQGKYSDAGFGQLNWVWWRGTKSFLCSLRGICSANDVIASPYVSMRSFLDVLKSQGMKPWCFINKRGKVQQPKACALDPGGKP
jgi:hypothetical protein